MEFLTCSVKNKRGIGIRFVTYFINWFRLSSAAKETVREIQDGTQLPSDVLVCMNDAWGYDNGLG
jgi:hypothetical protein